MDKLKEYFKLQKLSNENFNDYLKFIYNVMMFILWRAIIPSLTGLGFLFYTTRNGNPSYIFSFILAIGVSAMIGIWNKEVYERKGSKAFNRLKKRNKEISKLGRRLRNG